MEMIRKVDFLAVLDQVQLQTMGKVDFESTIVGLAESATRSILNQIPTVEAEPVKHGHWDRWDDTDTWNCSACGNEILEYDEDPVEYGVIYCDHCGARMDEKKD